MRDLGAVRHRIQKGEVTDDEELALSSPPVLETRLSYFLGNHLVLPSHLDSAFHLGTMYGGDSDGILMPPPHHLLQSCLRPHTYGSN